MECSHFGVVILFSATEAEKADTAIINEVYVPLIIFSSYLSDLFLIFSGSK